MLQCDCHCTLMGAWLGFQNIGNLFSISIDLGARSIYSFAICFGHTILIYSVSCAPVVVIKIITRLRLLNVLHNGHSPFYC